MAMKTNYKYHPYIDTYFEKVENGEIKASKHVKKLIRYLTNKFDDPKNKIVFDHGCIEDAVIFIEKYFPFKLILYQKFIIACMVGCFHDYDKRILVFTEFLLLMGRGAGKNALSSGLAAYFVSKQNVKRYNVDIVATSKDQAETSFLDVYNVLEDNEPKMKRHFTWTKKKIIHKNSKSEIKYYTNNAKTKDGLRPGCVIFDEVHQYESYDNIKVFTSALGKVECGRRIYLTTDGYVRGGVLDELKEEAELVLNGEKPNSKFFPFLCTLDDENEVDNFDAWEKANPSINYLPNLKEEMVNEYNNLQSRPHARIEFMTKRMNLPQEDTMFSVATWEQIQATNQEFPFEELKGKECVGSVDFSDINDFVGVGLLFRHNNKRYFLQHTFINQKALKNRNYKIDIDLAISEGLVTVLKTEVNDPNSIAEWFAEQAKQYDIKVIVGDAYRFKYVKEALEGYGFETKLCRSGKYTHTQLQPIVEEMFATRSIVFGENRMMRWFTNNVYADKDSKGNVSYEKIEPYLRKTDGFMALIHALTEDDSLKEDQPLTEEALQYMLKVYT